MQRGVPINLSYMMLGIIEYIFDKMLLVEEKTAKLPKRYQKVLNICPAVNNSFVFLGILGFRQDCLTHFNNEKLLGQKVFENNMDSFAMLSESEVMVLETRKSCFSIWNLETHEWIHVPFNYKNQEVDQSAIYVFPDTRTMCIQENGRYNDNTFRLSYYHLPIENEKAEAFHVFDSEEAWTYEYMIRKANNHSMVCWYKGRHDDGFEFRTYQVRDGTGKFNKYELANEVGKPENMNKTEVAITTMWEMRENEFLLVCISNRPEGKDGIPNNNYVADVKAKTIREAKFTLGKYQDLHLDQHYMGNTCMFRTFDFENGQPLETPVYYINNETEEVIAEETWKCSYLHKYEFPGYDGNMIVEGMYENADVEEVKIMSKKVMDPKEISVHFLSELIPKVDEDLLYDVTKLIDYKS